jgi:hypothetical protein
MTFATGFRKLRSDAGRPIVFACERRRMGLVMPPAAARNLPIRIEHLIQLKGR